MNYFALRFMRSLLIAFTTAVGTSSVALAAEVPPGFADVRLGASIADIKRAFAQRPDVELAEEASSRIVFRRGRFADYPVGNWSLARKAFGAELFTLPSRPATPRMAHRSAIASSTTSELH